MMSKEISPTLSVVEPSITFGVSVIIPAYNYAAFLPFAVDSALAQNYKSLEIIIVDDGSTDNTADIVASYGNRVRYIYQKNAGLSAARNTGILAAKHPFIAFLDADDVWLPSFVRRTMETFFKLGNDVGLIACVHDYIDSTGRPLHIRRHFLDHDCEISARDIIVSTRFAPSSVIARREVFDTCGHFDTSLRSSEDRDMWIRVAARYRAVRLPQPLVQIRRHGNNMSRHADRMKSNIAQVIRKSRENGIVPAWQLWFWMKVYSLYHFQTSLMFNGQRRRGKALASLCLSLLFWPWFQNEQALNQAPLFRSRALMRYILDSLEDLFASQTPSNSGFQ